MNFFIQLACCLMVSLPLGAMSQVKSRTGKVVTFAADAKEDESPAPKKILADSLKTIQACPEAYRTDFVRLCLQDPVYKIMIKDTCDLYGADRANKALEYFLEFFAVSVYQVTKDATTAIQSEMQRPFSHEIVRWCYTIYNPAWQQKLEAEFRQKKIMKYMDQNIQDVLVLSDLISCDLEQDSNLQAPLKRIARIVVKNKKIQERLLVLAEGLHKTRAEKLAHALARHRKSLAASLAVFGLSAVMVCVKA